MFVHSIRFRFFIRRSWRVNANEILHRFCIFILFGARFDLTRIGISKGIIYHIWFDWICVLFAGVLNLRDRLALQYLSFSPPLSACHIFIISNRCMNEYFVNTWPIEEWGKTVWIVQVPVSVTEQKKLNIHKIVGWETRQILDLLYFYFFFTAIKLVSYFEFMFGWFFCHNDRLMNSGHLLIILNLFSLFMLNTQYPSQWVRFLTTITISILFCLHYSLFDSMDCVPLNFYFIVFESQ